MSEQTSEPFSCSSSSQQAYIQHQSLLLLVSSLHKAIFVFPLTAIILTVLFWPHTNQILIGSWLLAIGILSLVRYTVHKKINQQKNTTINYARWLKYMLMLDVSGGTLAGFSSLFLPSLPQEFQWLLIIVIIAISMESVAGQSAIKSSFIAFILPLFSGFILGLILLGSTTSYILCVFALLHLSFLYGNFTAMHHHINTNLTLSFANQQLAGQLKQKNQALVLSNEQMNATSMAKSKFIISMSQELKAPLQGMLKLMESVQKSSYNPETLRSLSLIRSSGFGLLTLLDDLTDVYRLEQGKLTPKIKVFSVRQHFEDIAHLLAINAHVKGLKFFCTIDSKVPAKVESDPVRLSQITLNLLANALKFTTQGQIALKISSRVDAEQMLLTIAVSDTGIGINQADMKMIFQPFVQGTTDVETIGSGLGLAISRELCLLLDGKMSAQSVVGEGAVFSVEIPVKISQKSNLPMLHSKKAMLLVEGDSQHQTSIEHQLRFLNLPCETVTNAKDAMAICAEKRKNISAVIIGHQSALQQKLLINLCQRLKLKVIKLIEFDHHNDREPLTLNYPVKLAKLKAAFSQQ